MAGKNAAVAEPKVRPAGQPNYAGQAEDAAEAQHPVAEDAAVYVIEQTPAGEAVCRLAKAGEGEAFGGKARVPVRQINHLRGKDDAAAAASAGLTIILRGTQQLEANPQAKAAFIAAAARWEALVSSQITVTIDVDFGTTFFGQPYSSSNTLGATSSGGFIPSYSTVRGRLIQGAPAGSAEATLLNNLPASSLPTDIGAVSTVFVSTAQARALGLSFDESTAPVPRIGFNSAFAFDFDPADGINSTQTDFDAVAVHEIGHALGFTSRVGARELNPSSQLLATVWDIFRFRPGAGTAGTFSTAPRVLSSGTSSTDPHVYFGGGSEIALSTGRPDATGGDGQQASHWKDDRFGIPFIGIMDPTLPRGRREEITASDLAALDFFGYTLAGVAPPPSPPAPTNDDFADAQAISGMSGRVTGTNVGATKEAGEPSHSPDDDPGGKSVWYNWTAPSNGPVTFNTGAGASGEPASTFDTVLAAYTGAGINALTPVAKNDDANSGVVATSTITFNAAAGTTYRIAVDGWDALDGSVALNWSFGSVSNQLGCATNPSPITINGGPINGTLANGDCANPVDGSFYDAYNFTAPAGQLVIIEMTSTAFDTYLYLLRPGETALSYRTIQNDDTENGNNLNSRIVAVLPGVGDTTYTILANSAFAGATGSYTLSLRSVGNCAATSIGSGTPPNTSLASGDCVLHDNTFVDVYAFTATAGQQVSVTMSSSAVDSFLILLSHDGFTELARNDDGLTGGGINNSQRGARIPAPAEGAGAGLATLPAAGTYYILANSFSAGETGSYQLTLTLGANCPVQAITPGQTTSGQSLATTDCRLPFDGSFMDVYTFEGAAGQQVAITMTSTAFDSYLLLYDPAGFLVEENNDGAGGPDARIPDGAGFVTLPVTGTYRIYANAATPGSTGAYQLSVASPATALRIDTVTPAAGRDAGGQQVKLTGSFAGLSSVSFGGSPATWSYTNGTSEITVTTPPHAVGPVGIDLVPTSGSNYSKPNAFAYLPTTFTDNPLVAGVTTAKAQHVLELRQAADALRAVAGLPAAQWTDPALPPAATLIKAVHVAELRARIEEAAAALGLAPSAYTDPGLGAGGTIRRVHVEELRQRIRNIAG